MDLIAGCRQRYGAFMVALKRETVTVVAVAVGFDDDPLCRPKEVN